MPDRTRFWVRAMWVVIAVHVAGRALDFWWHATHAEFENRDRSAPSALAAMAEHHRRHRRLGGGHPGDSLKGTLPGAAAGQCLYVPVAAWHFWEHYRLRDPDAPHVVLAVAEVLIYASAIWVGVRARRQQRVHSGN